MIDNEIDGRIHVHPDEETNQLSVSLNFYRAPE
jgi:hypothetical protein